MKRSSILALVTLVVPVLAACSGAPAAGEPEVAGGEDAVTTAPKIVCTAVDTDEACNDDFCVEKVTLTLPSSGAASIMIDRSYNLPEGTGTMPPGAMGMPLRPLDPITASGTAKRTTRALTGTFGAISLDAKKEGARYVGGLTVQKDLSFVVECKAESNGPPPGTMGMPLPRPGVEGGKCGTIAGFVCEAGLSCHMEANHPDAAGTCVKSSGPPPGAVGLPILPGRETTVEGTLVHTMGIGGENTGASVRVGTKLVELVLDSGLQNQFVDGKTARVKGTYVTLTGVETGARRALKASAMLVCPEAGTLNCMPGDNVRLSSICSGESRAWVQAKCPGVNYVD